MQSLLMFPSDGLSVHKSLKDDWIAEAPLGALSWGINAETFTETGRREVSSASFEIGEVATLSLSETRGQLAFARLVQGFVWPNLVNGPVPWRIFEPLSWDSGLEIECTHRLDGLHKLSPNPRQLLLGKTPWVLVGLNVWVTGPNFVKTGHGRLGKKPLVLDLVTYCTTDHHSKGLRNFESALAFHYQTRVAREQGWSTSRIDLSEQIERAAHAFPHIGRPSLKDARVHQIEFVIEARRASVTASLASLTLSHGA